MKSSLIVGLMIFAVACSCTGQKEKTSAKLLPMDSSLAIIMEATALLSDSSVPDYWPRDFSAKQKMAHYIAYIKQNKPDQFITGMHRPIQPGSDSTFNLLIDQAARMDLQPIRLEDLRSLSGQRVEVRLTDGLKRNLIDNELGYIKVSPVTTNQQVDKAIFFYALYGDGYSSHIVYARRVKNRWVIVRQELIAIS